MLRVYSERVATLGIPTIRDRVIQMACKLVIAPISRGSP